MAKTEIVYLIGSCICGGVSLALLITSFSTDYWVTADLSSNFTEYENSVHFGLFKGIHERGQQERALTYEIYATCLYGENICIWSCRDTAANREAEAEALLNEEDVAFNCTSSSYERSSLLLQAKKNADTDDFINAGLYLTTIVFLSISLFCTAVAVSFNIYSTVGNPIEFYSSTKAVTWYYLASACFTLLTLILWGALYGTYILNNIAVVDTLTGPFNSLASLGWSYFLLIPIELAQLVAFGLLSYRDYIINKRDEAQIIKGDDRNNDATTFMY